MGPDNRQDAQESEDRQGDATEQQPGGQGVQPALESPGFEFENAGRGARDPESIGKQEGSWRPTDAPVGERRDGEAEGTGT